MKRNVLLLTLFLNVSLLILVGAFAVHGILISHHNKCLAKAEIDARFKANEVNNYVLRECLKSQLGHSFCKNIAEERGLAIYNETLISDKVKCD